MNVDGYIVFDDYLWSYNGVHTKDGIDKFIKNFNDYF